MAIPGYNPKVDFSKNSGRRLEEMLDGYEFSKADEYPCGIKACATKHQFGYVVKTSDGIFTNIGNRCGKKHLDLDYDRVKKEYKSKRKAFDNLASLTVIRESFHKYSSKIDWLTNAASILAGCRSKLFKAAPDQLSEAIQLGRKGFKDVLRVRRMSKKEAAVHYELTKTSSKDYEGRRPTTQDVVCRIVGGEIFKEDISGIISSQIATPLKALTDISDFSFSLLSDRALEKLSLDSNKAIRSISAAEQYISHGVSFYSPENLANMVVMGANKNSIELLISEISSEMGKLMLLPAAPQSEETLR